MLVISDRLVVRLATEPIAKAAGINIKFCNGEFDPFGAEIGQEAVGLVDLLVNYRSTNKKTATAFSRELRAAGIKRVYGLSAIPTWAISDETRKEFDRILDCEESAIRFVIENL